ncbi:glycosyltransferase [Parapedobacter koreensis]|uniref:Rhamnosyltransferase n=1 Tax=Parapedobacter koreensis TaxID=332977 RepID=A0A1H7U2R4_9SPHI|nr:glycosyltransferase [Parapedobacter koreensis]SEL91382.1 rhamnosyltransferase [Parapedobacter koreensis]
MKVNLYIPTLNAGPRFAELLGALEQQTYPIAVRVLVDSGSKDHTVELAREKGFGVIGLGPEGFDHGGTRQWAIANFPDADIYVFLTQDAIPAHPAMLANIVAAFADGKIGMAYGRQLPHKGATVMEAHARLFNYPAENQVRGLADAPTYGIKTISCSNSFAAYRRTALEEVGGFPSGTIMGEDVIVAGKLLLQGWKMAYVSDACVYHSHDYRIREEFERYFDIGVFHSDNPWIFESFGRAGGEGFRYAKSEIRYVARRNPFLLPRVFCSFAAKWLGYKLGLAYRNLPARWRRTFSMYKGYWN